MKFRYLVLVDPATGHKTEPRLQRWSDDLFKWKDINIFETKSSTGDDPTYCEQDAYNE